MSPAGTPGRRALGPRRWGTDRGLAALEVAILMPVILLIIFTMFQIALYWHAANVVGVAAESGVNAGQVVDRGQASGEAVAGARAILGSASFGSTPTVTANLVGGGDFIEVTIQADAVRLFGIGRWRVESTARGRMEEFVPADER